MIDDLKRFFDTVNYNDKEPLKVAIRKFYKWLYQTDDYPQLVKWIKLKTKKKGWILSSIHDQKIHPPKIV
jgi:hypothetical protein